ncbi:unnamed protein product [Ectocarpus fasciculatus]
MHVASPGLPEAALRHLFFQAATTGAPRPSSFSAGRAGGDGGGQTTAPAITTTSPPTRQRTSNNRNNVGRRSGSFRQSGKGGGGGGGGGGDGESTSASGLARAVVGFPLACEGLAPLVASTATELSARSLLKQVAHQAKEALEETEKVVASIKEAQGTATAERGSGGGGFVPEAEISAVEARTSQLRAFMINADTSRNALDVSKLWISRRMLVAETTLLRAYGGVGPTARAQDAIRQGRRLRLRRIFRAFEMAWREKLMSRTPEETLETIEPSDCIE